MDEIWIYVIEAVIVAAISVFITIISKNGWESKIIGIWEKMKITYNNWKDQVAEYDPEFAISIENAMNTLENAFADGGLTLSEFNDIRKSLIPVWEKFVEIIGNLKSLINKE